MTAVPGAGRGGWRWHKGPRFVGWSLLVCVPLIAFAVWGHLWLGSLVQSPQAAEIRRTLGEAWLLTGLTTFFLVLTLACTLTRRHRDTLERLRHTRHELRRAHAYVESLFRSMVDALVVVDGQGKIKDANPAALSMFGLELTGLRARHFSEFFADPDEGTYLLEELAQRERLHHAEATLRISDKSLLPVLFTGGKLADPDPACEASYVCILHDISHRRVAQEKILHLAYHDQLTGLPNRALFLDRLQQAIAHASRHRYRIVLFCLDLDRFKDLNDTLGHEAGDQLLKQVVSRISPMVRRSDTLARLGNDEFVLLLTSTQNNEAAIGLAAKIVEVISVPFEVNGEEIHTSASIGIVFYPDDGEDGSALLRNADLAMYEAKASGGNQYHVFSKDMQARIQDRTRIEGALRQAFLTDQLHLAFQPVLDLHTGALLGAEALCRWVHPDLGPISPARFIPVAEQIGLIRYLGEWVLWTACQYAKQWYDEARPWTMWVNVSAAQLHKPDFPDQVAAALRDADLPPHALGLELTESMLMGNERESIVTIRSLKALGISLAMDDFGTGYSSLSYLRDFEVDKLKVDRAFITHLPSRPDAQAIVRAIVAMGHSLNLKITAEGIETEGEAEVLRQLDVDEAQGYLFAKPLNPDAFDAFLEARRHR